MATNLVKRYGMIIAMVVGTIATTSSSANAQDASGGRFKKLANAEMAVPGYPTEESAQTLSEELYFQRAVQTYLWALPAM
ncbi:MAG: hypothetical protein WEE51_10160, partial [Pirellulaceae bacterium]